MKAKWLALAVIIVSVATAGLLLFKGSLSADSGSQQVSSPPLAASAGSPLPVASFTEVRYQFAQALEGDKVSHDFTVKNLGGQTLLIEKVLTS